MAKDESGVQGMAPFYGGGGLTEKGVLKDIW